MTGAQPVDEEVIRKEITVREVINVMALFQMAMGGLYFFLGALGIFIINTSIGKTQLPDDLDIIICASEGLIMITVGFITTYGAEKKSRITLRISMTMNVLLIIWQSLKFGWKFHKNVPNQELHGSGLLWVIEVIFYLFYCFSIYKLISTLHLKVASGTLIVERSKSKAQMNLKTKSVLFR